MNFLYRTISLCIVLILFRNLLLYLDNNFSEKPVLLQEEYRYYHTNHSALCADGITMYGKCSRKSDK
jgi:hypothetical protein